MSSAERQRYFLERHPDYYRKYRARRQAALEARLLAKAKAEAEAEAAAAATREPLMLPAPAEPLVLPGLHAIGAAPAPLSLPRPDTVKIAA